MTTPVDITHPLPDRIDAWLPQTQCTQCGYPSCRAYAEAVAVGSADINRCPPGNGVTIRALAELRHMPPKPLDPGLDGHRPRARAVIDEALCIGCRKCIDACPVDAIIGARKLMHTVMAPECTGCELCLPPCPVDCIAMVRVAPVPGNSPWPEYARADTEHWRARAEQRRERLARRRRPRRGKSPGNVRPSAGAIPPIPSDRAKIRAEIRAAVERVKTKRKIRQD